RARSRTARLPRLMNVRRGLRTRWRCGRWSGAAAIALAAACSKAPTQAFAPVARETLEVQMQPVAQGPIARFVRANGTLFGEEQTRVSAKVTGRIDAVYRDVGATVQPGDPLARVEPTDYSLAVAEKRRGFEQALARIGLTALPGEDFAVDDLPSVQRARLQ